MSTPRDVAENNQWISSYATVRKPTSYMTFIRLITDVLCDKQTTVSFVQENNMIARERKCPVCGELMKVVIDSGKKASSDGIHWACRRKRKEDDQRHQKYLSIRTGSWFEKSNLTLAEILKLTYAFAWSWTEVQMQHELGMGPSTLVDWNMFCREVAEAAVLKRSMKIGGNGKTVEIDESKFCKRKYHKGHHIEGQWVFGGVERGDRSKMFMVAVEDRSKETLIPIILQWVLPGTTVISDFWKSYDVLPEHDYFHLKVNHSLHFKDPDTGAHTNHIECEWRHAKNSLPKYGIKKKYIASYLGAHLWRTGVKTIGVDPFYALLHDIVELYNPEEWEVPAVHDV